MENCIFCQIIKGDLPTNKVYENERVLAIHDINPEAPVHVLIFTKKHISDLSEASEEDQALLGEMLLTVNKVATLTEIKDSGFRTIINTGKNANPQVKHLHVHVLGGKNLGSKLVK